MAKVELRGCPENPFLSRYGRPTGTPRLPKPPRKRHFGSSEQVRKVLGPSLGCPFRDSFLLMFANPTDSPNPLFSGTLSVH